MHESSQYLFSEFLLFLFIANLVVHGDRHTMKMCGHPGSSGYEKSAGQWKNGVAIVTLGDSGF